MTTRAQLINEAATRFPRPVLAPYNPGSVYLQFARLINFGYLLGGRTFAYLGFPGLYPAELLLVVATLHPRHNWLGVMRRRLGSHPALPLSILAFLAWGLFEAMRGYLDGFSTIDGLKELTVNYYPILLFVGMGLGARKSVPELRRTFGVLTLLSGIYCTFTVILNNRGTGPTIPWNSDVPLFSGPALPGFCMLVFISLSDRITTYVLLCCLSCAIPIVSGRGILVGTFAGIAIICRRSARLKHVAPIAAVAVLLLTFLSLLGSIPDLGGRIGTLSPGKIAARVIAVFDIEAAESLAPTAEDAESLGTDAGTAEWRRNFWQSALGAMETPGDWIFGLGYGRVLGALLDPTLGQQDLRSPHNFGVYLLCYTGLVGCLLFLILVAAFISEVLRCRDGRLRDALFSGGISILLMSFTGNVFETPVEAVPFYINMGILLGAGIASSGRGGLLGKVRSSTSPSGLGQHPAPLLASRPL